MSNEAGKKVFVHRHKWSHSKKRSIYKKLEKEGLVKKIEAGKEGWLYKHVVVSI